MPFELPAAVYKKIFNVTTKEMALCIMADCPSLSEEWDETVPTMISKCEQQIIKFGKELLEKHSDELLDVRRNAEEKLQWSKLAKKQAKADTERKLIMEEAIKYARSEASKTTVESHITSTSSVSQPMIKRSTQFRPPTPEIVIEDGCGCECECECECDGIQLDSISASLVPPPKISSTPNMEQLKKILGVLIDTVSLGDFNRANLVETYSIKIARVFI